MDYSKLVTENQNPESMRLDEMSTLEVARLMNRVDAEVPLAVEKTLPQVAEAVDHITAAFRNGGRLIYVGAGTSGRLGVLDAAECLPTFGAGKEMVDARIAGGDAALCSAVEGAEDREDLGEADLRGLSFSEKDVLVAISASGSAPYCIGALKYAKERGAYTAGVCCVDKPAFAEYCSTVISAVVGPEILTGSTRLRAGTATKLILNMLSTISMVRFGKVYGNLMVDMVPTNKKLTDRAVRMIQTATGVPREGAEQKLSECGDVKTSIVSIETGSGPKEAKEALDHEQGSVRNAIRDLKR